MNSPAELDPRDRLLQAHAPALMVPRHGALALPDKPGHRFLVASDGIWLEVLRPWLFARVSLGITKIPLPFGDVGQRIEYSFPDSAVRAIERRFLQDAERAFPHECAAWGVYDEHTGALEYRPMIADEASRSSIRFHRPKLADHEHLAIDLHSHGELEAGFSGTDDEDDAGEVKIAVVVGNVNGALTWESRLCLLGTYVYPDAEPDRPEQ